MTQPPPPELNLTGTCDCGGISLTVQGRPRSMFQCACLNCQKTSGSGHSSVVLFSPDQIAIAGELQSYDRPAASGATFTRRFCGTCGTTVLAQSSRAEGLYIVPVGIFAGHNDWFTPNQLIFSHSHPEWDLVDEAMPQHDGYRVEADR